MMARARHPLQGGLSPAWAVAWGENRYGAFAAFEVGPTDGPPEQRIEQRMRWIPAGTFRMGSPETERGRFDSERPQHDVTLIRGYWLGETPVTQALWVAVMGENPSRFRGERPEDLQRPVEQVSWEGCQVFLDRLNAHVPGLAARLPTETEWERACRAGTTTATWVGELSGEVDAPELDSIAWYHGNSGGETHPVGRKAPNPYGLHDILGNVWEWCAPSEGSLGSLEFYRGGSWYDSAGRVRAALRGASPRDGSGGNLGFRMAGGQESALR